MSVVSPEQLQESLALVVQQMVRAELGRVEANFRDTLKTVEERLEKKVVAAQHRPLRSSLRSSGSISSDSKRSSSLRLSFSEKSISSGSKSDDARSDKSGTDVSDADATDVEADVEEDTPVSSSASSQGRELTKRPTVVRLEKEIAEQEQMRKQRAKEIGELKKQLTEMHMELQDGSRNTAQKDELIEELTQAKKRWSLETRQLREQLQKKTDQVHDNKPRKSVQEEVAQLHRQLASFQRLFDARNRFGCWICNQQTEKNDSDSDEGSEENEKDAETREMREEIEDLKRQIAEEKAAQAGGTSCAPIGETENDSTKLSGGVSFRERESVWQIENCQTGEAPQNETKKSDTSASNETTKLGRSVRGRQATGFVKAEAVEIATSSGNFEDREGTGFSKQGVQFADSVDVEEADITTEESTGTGSMRPARLRIATPFISSDAMSVASGNVTSPADAGVVADTAKTLSFAEDVQVEEQDVSEITTGSGSMRPARQRVATPFISPDAMTMAAGKVQHATDSNTSEDATVPHVTFAEQPSLEGTGTQRAQRVVSEDVASIQEVEPDAMPMRSTRNRVATPAISADALAAVAGKSASVASLEETKQDDDKSRKLMFSKDIDVEEQTVEVQQGEPALRPTRARVATPFISPDAMNLASGKVKIDDDEGQQSASQVVPEETVTVSRGSAPRPLTLSQTPRVIKDFIRRGRESRAHNEGHFIKKDLGEMMAHPDQNLKNRKVEQARVEHDMEVIGKALRSVDFCADMDDEEIEAVSTSMDLYDFGDGEHVCTQGDAHGTHFFIVASGKFNVYRDGVQVNQLLPGIAFGESVFLLNGERTATVAALGQAAVYGMEGAKIREVMREHYVRGNAKLHAMFESLTAADAAIPMFQNLNAYQNQQLCDQATHEVYAAGSVIPVVGHGTPQLVALVSGSVKSRDASGSEQALGQGDRILGVDQLLFGTSPATLIAETVVEALCFPKPVLSQVFGDSLQKVLFRNIILLGLCRNTLFGRLPHDLRDKIASRADVIDLEPGEELQAPPTLRFVICLHGEVSARPKDGSVPLSARLEKLRGTPSVDSFGDKYVINSSKTWDHRIRASSQSGAKIALLGARAVRELQKFDDLEKSIEHDEKVRILLGVFVFQNLPASQLDMLVSAFQVQHYKTGETIFAQGEHGDKFYVVREGLISIHKDGKTVRTLTKHDYFGERALLYDEPRTATVVADEDTECWFVMKKVFIKVLKGPILEYLEERIRLQDTKIVFMDLQTIGVLGRGGFGVVKLVVHKNSGTKYALKCLNRRRAVEQKAQESLISELRVLREVDHPFIIKLVRSYKDDLTLYFLTEVVSGGELLDALDAIGLLNVEQTQFYAGSLILVLEYLHDRRIVYLDLKSENVLVDHQGFLKLIDFGAAKKTKGLRIHALEGTPVFMAPEVILGKGYTCSADLWSLGICVYEFMIGEFPFANHCKNQHEIFEQVLKAPLKFPAWFDMDHSRSLMSGLLTRDPSARLGATCEGYHSLKDHPFFDGFVWEALLGRQLKPPYLPTRTIEDVISANKKQMGKSASMEFAEDVNVEDDWVDPDPAWAADF
eukprot:gnl/MRDRNA2_/MRDRNA2_77640_c0_seq2.p1 gnl/MRDRNA2_/MRDRNA2_77640_c0~~gnl/MRDRNA2_/MRDRNA2_77640_c0_seq2.p1  ORF type:complete len:1573 (-),score=369.51 gnl/MRDRNA2_/MRDRNA2_77640_c0_seq2:216-4934(-)